MSPRALVPTSTAALLSVLISTALVEASDIWQVHLRYGPAPPPDERPPFSRNATYNLSHLKWQIPIIVGSYLAVVCFISVCLLTFGRRMRQDAQLMKGPRSLEMVKPSGTMLDPSPVSPSSSSSLWRKWGSPRMGSVKSNTSPTDRSVVSFDPNVIQTDRVRRQEEMERIYDEIIAQEAKAPKAVSVREREIQDDSRGGDAYYGHTRNISSSSRSFSRRHPPQSPQAQQFYLAQSPPITGGVQAVYPPYAPMPNDPNAATTTGPGYTGYNTAIERRTSPPPVPPPPTRPLSPQTPSQRPPPYSHSRQGSNASTKSKTSRSSARNMRISHPIPVPTMQDEFDVKTPLSPRFPREPRPPTPPTAGGRRHTVIEDSSDSEADQALSPSGRSRKNPPKYQGDYPTEEDVIQTDDDAETEGIIRSYTLRTPRPLPPTSPQRATDRTPMDTNYLAASSSSLPQARPISRTNTPNPLHLNTSTKNAASSSNQTLPFRAILPPNSIGNQMVSPNANQPTFLSPRRDHFLPGGMHSVGPNGLVPNSAALLSAGLASPYSPYMPFSPMTPVTPHLTTRRERREMARDRGRQAVTQDDVVQDEKDMWGDAWD